MVIGIEGNVHVGKTSYINNNFKGFNIIKETDFQKNLKSYDRQLYYLNKEIKKKDKLTNNTILDRTIISIIIYTLYTNTLKQNEKNKLIKIINENLKNNQFIIPSFIYLILYPYKLICLNHKKLVKEKKTQNYLVDYDYYLKYSLFFANRLNAFDKIISINDYRQIISYKSNIFNCIIKDITCNSKVLIDGYEKDYIWKDYTNQIDKIVENINLLNNGNITLNNSFLWMIAHIFCNKSTSKNFKLKIIDEIMNNIPLNNYVTKIICFYSDYNSKKANFYKILNKRLGNMSNINFINKLDTNDIYQNIDDIKNKPLLLIDLFYEIKEGIKEGEI